MIYVIFEISCKIFAKITYFFLQFSLCQNSNFSFFLSFWAKKHLKNTIIKLPYYLSHFLNL